MSGTVVRDGKKVEAPADLRFCPGCRQQRQTKHLRLVERSGDVSLVDPEQVLVVHSSCKRVVFILRGGRRIVSWHSTVVGVLRTYPDIFMPISQRVLVQRGIMRRAQRRGDTWFIEVDGYDGQLAVSRRKWALIRELFNTDSEPISVAAAGRAIGQ